MRSFFFAWACVVVAVLAIVLAQVRGDEDPSARDSQQAGSQQEGDSADEPLLLRDDEPPLRLGDEPPLLLDGSGGDETKQVGADNSRCQVCHLNMVMEKISVIHAKEKIGCADCHGNCDAHIDDESWASGGPGTPPGIMYPRAKIDNACEQCHDMHDVPARDVIARWQERCKEISDPADVVCTDCHGHHRLNPKLRKAWWNKETGEPIDAPVQEESGDTPSR